MKDFIEYEFFKDETVLFRVVTYAIGLILEATLLKELLPENHVIVIAVIYFITLGIVSLIIYWIVYDRGDLAGAYLYANSGVDSVFIAKVILYISGTIWLSVREFLLGADLKNLLMFQIYGLIVFGSAIVIWFFTCSPFFNGKEKKSPLSVWREKKINNKIKKIKFNVFELEENKELQLFVIQEILDETMAPLVETPSPVFTDKWDELIEVIEDLYNVIQSYDNISNKELREKVIDCEVALLKVEYTAHLNIMKLLTSNPNLNYEAITYDDLNKMIDRYKPITKDIKELVSKVSESEKLFLSQKDKELEDDAKRVIRNTMEFLG